MKRKILNRFYSGLNPVNKILNTLVGCVVLTSFFALSNLFFKSAEVEYNLWVPSLGPEPSLDNWIEPHEITEYYDRHDLELSKEIRSFCDELIQLPKPFGDKDTRSIPQFIPLFPLEELRDWGFEEKLNMTSDNYKPSVLFEPWVLRHGFSENSGFAKELISFAKEKLTEREYYQFIVAFLYARRVENILEVKNIGNLSAKNINIYINSTQTLISGMKSSIISITSLFPANFNIDDYQAIIHIPYLKATYGNKIHIVTREACLFKMNISLDYDTEKTIKVTVLLLIFLISFAVASVFALIFGKHFQKL